MNVQQTSIEAFHDIQPKLPKSRRKVYDELHMHADMTNKEMARALGKEINTITPRMNELVRAGLVTCSQIRTCQASGKRVIAWKVTNRN